MKLKNKEQLREEMEKAKRQAEEAGWIDAEKGEGMFPTKWAMRAKTAHDKMKVVIKVQNDENVKRRRYEVNEYVKKYGKEKTKEMMKKYYAKGRY